MEKAFWDILGGGGAGKRIDFPGGQGYIQRDNESKKIKIGLSNPDEVITLNGSADLRRLVSGAKFNLLDAASSREWLDKSLLGFHSDFSERARWEPPASGGPGELGIVPQPNGRGAIVFNYAVSQQVLHSIEEQATERYKERYTAIVSRQQIEFTVEGFRSWLETAEGEELPGHELAFRLNESASTIIGMECEASAMFNQFKAVGIVPADMERLEFELRFTHLHDAQFARIRRLAASDGNRYGKYARAIAQRIPNQIIAFTDALRKGNGYVVAPNPKVTDPDVRDLIANILNDTDWALLTGAAKKTFDSIAVREPKTAVEEGQTIYYHPGGYARILSGAYRGLAKADDSHGGFDNPHLPPELDPCAKDQAGHCHGVTMEGWPKAGEHAYALLGK